MRTRPYLHNLGDGRHNIDEPQYNDEFIEPISPSIFDELPVFLGSYLYELRFCFVNHYAFYTSVHPSIASVFCVACTGYGELISKNTVYYPVVLWYKETTPKLYEILETSDRGLSASAVRQRQREYGLNELSKHGDAIWKVILEPFRNIFVGVLLLAATVSLFNHESLDAVIIAAIILVNAAIFYVQHYATQRVLRSLKKHSESTVLVTRDGLDKELSSTQLVPGDIVTLQEGDRVPADMRIVHTDMLQIDESSLTGESVPVHKHASTLSADKEVYEQDNMTFQGTYVLAGTARAVVVATGPRTEFGKIADLAADQNVHSPVQDKIDALVALLIKVIAGVVAVVFVLALVRGLPAGESLRFVLSLSVSAVPEGLPVALTVIIVLGMRRMAKKHALVRSFKAIEDVGLITTIATDKTGTLTKNHLTVAESWSVSSRYHALSVAQHTIDDDVSQGDPLDTALRESTTSDLAKPDKVYSFDIGLRLSGAYYAAHKTLYIKGSPEHVLAKSQLSKADHHEAESQMHKLAAEGYRIIAVARRDELASKPTDLSTLGNNLTFVGYVAFADELRPDAAKAISAARKAGIDVKLITGDHFETALNIGGRVGLADGPGQVASGLELPNDEVAFAEIVREHAVFARILPEDKYRILQSLKQTEIVAMTGDGVNDVPALANAHVGFAMGSGNDIARDAGDVVLLRDSFSTIIAAIAEGRRIYDNIRRMLFYLLATTLGEVMTMIGALVFGLPLPVTAIQILWINLVTDTALVLPLGLEPAEDGLMKRSPRRPNEPLLSRLLLSRMVLVAAVIAVVALIAVFVLDRDGHDTAYIQTVAFMVLIAAQWANALNARSETASIFSRAKVVNRGMLVGFTVAFALQMLVMFGPLAGAFHIQPVPLTVLVGWSLAAVIAVLLAGETHKLLMKKR